METRIKGSSGKPATISSLKTKQTKGLFSAAMAWTELSPPGSSRMWLRYIREEQLSAWMCLKLAQREGFLHLFIYLLLKRPLLIRCKFSTNACSQYKGTANIFQLHWEGGHSTLRLNFCLVLDVLGIEAVVLGWLFGCLAMGMYLEELYQVQQFQLVSCCAGDQSVIYLVLQVPQEGIMENGSLTLIYLLWDIHPSKKFLIIHNGTTCFHFFASFSYHPSFPPCDNFRTPSSFSLPQAGGEGRGWRRLKDTRFPQVLSEKNTSVTSFVSKGLESEFAPS